MPVSRKKIDKLYDEDFWNDDTHSVAPDDIFSFTEIRSCADIFRMYKTNVLKIQPDFQRDFVWGKSDQTRFIDSIIKGFPIPSLCFSYDAKKQEWLVIDGLQRISTIISFVDSSSEKYSKLEDVDPLIAGQSPLAIRQKEDCNDIVTRIENCSLPITVLRCDYSKKEHLAFLFTVFHRLNSTGVKLNNQEIRNCIYGGTFNQMLRDLDGNPDWKFLNRRKENKTNRMRSQEMILRFFAFYENLSAYDGKLSGFLNDYMNEKKSIGLDKVQDYSNLFNSTVSCLSQLVRKSLIEKAPISLVVQDALMYGIGKNIDSFSRKSFDQQAILINSALKLDNFSESQLSEGTMRKNKLISRLESIAEALR